MRRTPKRKQWIPLRITLTSANRTYYRSKKTHPQKKEQMVITVVAYNNIQQCSVILTLINFNPIPFPFYFCIFTAHTLLKPGASCGSTSVQLRKWVTVFPITTPLHPPLHPFYLSFSLAPWRHVKCAQISVMGWEFITFTLRPFMRSHPREVCLPERSTAQ